MDPVLAVSIAGAVVLAAAIIGIVWRARSGRARRTANTTFAVGDLPGVDDFASGATLVQFSTEYCAVCPATRRYLAQVAGERGGVAHRDVDLTHRPELAKRLKILQTPTVFVLAADGALVARFGGAPRRAELEAVLDELVPTPEWNL